MDHFEDHEIARVYHLRKLIIGNSPALVWCPPPNMHSTTPGHVQCGRLLQPGVPSNHLRRHSYHSRQRVCRSSHHVRDQLHGQKQDARSMEYGRDRSEQTRCNGGHGGPVEGLCSKTHGWDLLCKEAGDDMCSVPVRSCWYESYQERQSFLITPSMRIARLDMTAVVAIRASCRAR
jgi:hypothetical protein